MYKHILIEFIKLFAFMLIFTLHKAVVRFVSKKVYRMLFAATYLTDISSIPFDQMTIILQAFTAIISFSNTGIVRPSYCAFCQEIIRHFKMGADFSGLQRHFEEIER